MKTKLLVIFSCALALHAQASNATWNLDPLSGDWNTAANWTPETVPNNIATFDVSNLTNVSLSGGILLGRIVFTTGASAFSIDTGVNYLFLSNGGVLNHSANTQQFLLSTNSSGQGGLLQFSNGSTAGSGIVYTMAGSQVPALNGGLITFLDTSTAADASFILQGGSSGANTIGGRVVFNGTSTGDHATFVCQPGGDTNFGGTLAYVRFAENARADHATITAEGAPDGSQYGGVAVFAGQSKAENATLIANGPLGASGGTINFSDTATGDNATVKIYGNGVLVIVGTAGAGVSIGSLQGTGQVLLGTKRLTIGGNGLDTTFRGRIGVGGETGAITKVGRGTLTLASGTTYTGGTIVEAGRLLANNQEGSATGTGAVQVNGGTLGGIGSVAGAVTIGTGTLSRAILAPGVNGIGLLTLQNSLTIKAGNRYAWDVDFRRASADEVIANGITIEAGASVAITPRGHDSLPVGTVLTAISNTAATPINGTFANLPNESTITVGGNTFQVSYSGGDGNDLTLTAVP